jgi:uncharacterized integral membrane protein
MNKFKGLLLLLLGALLVIFAVENSLPAPQIKLFRYQLGKPPVFLLVYGSLLIGFLAGWLAHVLKIRRQKRAEALIAEKPQAPQAPQEQERQ